MSDYPLDKTENRKNFPHFLEIPTRWGDHDGYDHVNNAMYFTFFEQVIMHYLEIVSELNLATGSVRCFTAENLCRYHAPLKFPDTIEAGLRVARLGNSSVRYEIGLFVKGSESVFATGYFVDVFVNAETETPCRIPEDIRACLAALT